MKKNLQKSAILFGAKSNAYLQINRPIFAYSWLFLPIFAYLRICSKSPRIYFAFRAEYPCLFLPIFCHLTCGNPLSEKEASKINPIVESFLKHEAIRYQKRLMRQRRTQSWPECPTLLPFKKISTIYVANNGTQTDDST